VNEKDTKHTHIRIYIYMSFYMNEMNISINNIIFVHVYLALSLGDGRSPNNSVPSVHID